MVQEETLDQDSTESDKGSVADESGLPANDSDETDISTPEPNSTMSTKVGLPLPMTLEELYSGTTKEAVVFRTNRSSEEDGRSQVILNIRIDAGMNAGQEIQATVGRSLGHGERTIVFKIYEVRHIVSSTHDFIQTRC
jgi:hypothetical protein